MRDINTLIIIVMLCPAYLFFRIALIIEKVKPEMSNLMFLIPAWMSVFYTLKIILRSYQNSSFDLYLHLLTVVFYLLTFNYELFRAFKIRKLKKEGKLLTLDSKIFVTYFLKFDLLIVFFVFVGGICILKCLK